MYDCQTFHLCTSTESPPRSSSLCPFLHSLRLTGQAPLQCALQVARVLVERRCRGTSPYRCNFSTCRLRVTKLEREVTKLLLNAPVRQHDDNILPRCLGNLPSIIRTQPCQCSRESTAAAPANQHGLVAHEQLHGGESICIIRLYPRVDHMGLSGEHVRSKVIADTLDDGRTAFTYLVQGGREGKNGTNLRRCVFKQISIRETRSTNGVHADDNTIRVVSLLDPPCNARHSAARSSASDKGIHFSR
jgi:hypothetical protein